ncbi:hypothetical protein MKX01_026486 [Papaver californicum]|nr:hypothetical protein MKX01_026486 [Papaver californicum]
MLNGKSLQQLAVEGQKHLEYTIETAFQILSSMNDELCNPALWCSTCMVSSHSSNDVNADASDSFHQSELGGKNIFEWSTVGGSESGVDQAEMEKLQVQVITLRKELADKNKHVELLTDQFRELITDISIWKRPCSLWPFAEDETHFLE